MKKLIIFLMLALVLFVSGCTMSYDYETCSKRGDCISMDQKDCLNKIASDYCIANNFSEGSLDWFTDYAVDRAGNTEVVTYNQAQHFSCTKWFEQTRTTEAYGEGQRFFYTSEEKESCKGGGD